MESENGNINTSTPPDLSGGVPEDVVERTVGVVEDVTAGVVEDVIVGESVEEEHGEDGMDHMGNADDCPTESDVLKARPLSDYTSNHTTENIPERCFIQCRGLKEDDMYVNLDGGCGWENSTEGWVRTLKVPSPLLYDGDEKRRYFLIMLLLREPFRRPSVTTLPWMDDLISWSLAAAIRLNRNTETRGHCILPSAKILRKHPHEVLIEFWKACKDKSSQLLVIGDKRYEMRFYLYNGKTYTEIAEIEIRKLVNDFITYVYGEDVPLAASTEKCKHDFTSLLVSQNPLTRAKKNEKALDGMAFANVFANVTSGEDGLDREIKPIQYTPEMVCINRLDTNYIRAQFKDVKNSQTELVVSNGFAEFLPRLVRQNARLGYALKGLLRGIICSKAEGSIFQTCLYLYGPPSSGKSEIVKMLENMCGVDQVTHLTRHHTQFSAGQVEGCRLLVINDVQHLRRQHIDLLKSLLGRDRLTFGVKYQSMPRTVTPTCQVVMVSNHPPEAFKLLREEGIIAKFIVVGLEQTSRLDESSRIPDFHQTCLNYSNELFNWAVHSRTEDLLHHVRAEYYNEQRDNGHAVNNLGLHSFISEALLYLEPSSDNASVFTSVHEIMTALETYAMQNQDDEINIMASDKRRNAPGDLGRQLEKLMRNSYKKECPFIRYTKNNQQYGTARPYGLANVALMPSTGEIPAGFSRFVPVTNNSRAGIDQLLLSSVKIARLRGMLPAGKDDVKLFPQNSVASGLIEITDTVASPKDTPKRPRGRPRKLKLQQDVLPSPRKRGRPRKQVLEEQLTV